MFRFGNVINTIIQQGDKIHWLVSFLLLFLCRTRGLWPTETTFISTNCESFFFVSIVSNASYFSKNCPMGKTGMPKSVFKEKFPEGVKICSIGLRSLLENSCGKGQIRTQAKLRSKVYTVFYAWRNCFFLPGSHAKNVCLWNALIYSSIGIKLSLVIVFIRIYMFCLIQQCPLPLGTLMDPLWQKCKHDVVFFIISTLFNHRDPVNLTPYNTWILKLSVMIFFRRIFHVFCFFSIGFYVC